MRWIGLDRYPVTQDISKEKNLQYQLSSSILWRHRKFDDNKEHQQLLGIRDLPQSKWATDWWMDEWQRAVDGWRDGRLWGLTGKWRRQETIFTIITTPSFVFAARSSLRAPSASPSPPLPHCRILIKQHNAVVLRVYTRVTMLTPPPPTKTNGNERTNGRGRSRGCLLLIHFLFRKAPRPETVDFCFHSAADDLFHFLPFG